MIWLWPEEIRLFAAVSLVEPYPELYGRFSIHPLTDARMVEVAGEFGTASFIAALAERAGSIAAEERTRDSSYLPERAAAPTRLEIGSQARIHELIEAIEIQDELMLRGLSRFLASNHLISYRAFLEESAVVGYIALEAALEYIRGWLKETTSAPAKFKDVFSHIRLTFPTGEPFAGVLETDYEARVLMIHPASRFGEYWAPPVHAEECFELIYSLVHLYRYILLGEVWDPAAEERTLRLAPRAKAILKPAASLDDSPNGKVVDEG
jgi:hypothetical protein